MAGETNIGGIVGFLRLQADQFHHEIERALAEIEILDGKRVNVDVNVDKTGAASIAKTRAEVGKLDDSVKKVDASVKSADGSVRKFGTTSRDSGRGMGALATAIITIGPALVPIAAGATALAAAFGGMGAAGVLAIVGVKREMEQATTSGLAFKAGIDSVKSDINDLAGIAARNVLKPFQDAVKDLNDRMPALRGQIGDFATITGKAAGALAGGLLAAFQQLQPMMQDAAVYILNLSTRFQALMSGPGVVAFGDYVRSVFPQVIEAVEAIVSAAVRLVAAFAPLGLGTLSILRVLADVINSIPVDTLAALATTAVSVFVGFRTWQGLNVLIGGVATAMETVGVSAGRAATAVRGLQAAAGIVGIAIAALSFLMTSNAESQRNAQQATDDYADALRRSNGVIDESIRKVAYDTLQKQGAVDAAKQLGIGLDDLTLAATGNQDAMARVNAVIMDAIQNHRNLWGAAHDLRSALGENNTELKNAQQANKDLADATGQTASATSNAVTATDRLAASYGASAATFQAVQQGQQGIAEKAAQATLKMQMENDAAGILKQSLDALNGEALSAAQAQNAFDSSLANMGDHVTATGKKIQFTTTSIHDMSAASVALRGQLNDQVANLQRVVEANGGLADSTGKARQQMVTMRQQIIDNAVAHGVDRKAVTEYIDKLLKIPKSVPPTKLDVDKAAAEKKAKEFIGVINGVPTWRTTTLQVRTEYVTTGKPGVPLAGNINPKLLIAHAAGALTAPDGTRKMAAGDIVGRPSMIMRSTKPITWNEAPGGEAYISLAPQQRARSQSIWEETGKLLGMAGGAQRGGMSRAEMTTLARLFGDEIRQMKVPVMALDPLSKGLAY